jgi:hypothetical protein
MVPQALHLNFSNSMTLSESFASAVIRTSLLKIYNCPVSFQEKAQNQTTRYYDDYLSLRINSAEIYKSLEEIYNNQPCL